MSDQVHLGGNESVKAAAIDKVIAESMATNSAPQPSNVTPIGSPVRGRGRPRKGGAPNAATLEKLQSVRAEFRSPSSSSGEIAAAPSSSAPEPMPERDMPDEMVEAALHLPFTLAREWTGYDGYKLSDDTAKEAVPHAKACIRQYFPALEKSPHFPLYMLLGTIGIPLFKQTLDFQKFKRAKQVEATVSNPDPQPSPGAPGQYPPRPVFA